VVQRLVGKQYGVFDEDGAGSQDEGREQVDVDVVLVQRNFLKEARI